MKIECCGKDYSKEVQWSLLIAAALFVLYLNAVYGFLILIMLILVFKIEELEEKVKILEEKKS